MNKMIEATKAVGISKSHFAFFAVFQAFLAIGIWSMATDGIGWLNAATVVFSVFGLVSNLMTVAFSVQVKMIEEFRSIIMPVVTGSQESQS